MRFIKPDTNFDFVGRKKLAFLLSITCIVISFLSLAIHKGPRLGVDFAGGTLVQLKSGLATMGLSKSSVQQFGQQTDHEFLIRTELAYENDEGIAAEIKSALKSSTEADVEIRRVEMVGPQVGEDLRKKALFAMFYALLFITIYISGRFELKWLVSGVVAAALIGVVYIFNLFDVSIPFLIGAALIVSLIVFWFLELKYAMGAIVALIHDVIITVGIFSIFDKEFTLPIIAALLTIIGYSLNDTIIVFDRIRENLRKHHKKPLPFIINRSINETLSRTLLTSLTTLVVVVTLFILGGGIIHDFAFALIIGIVVGTYSSVFVASPILLAWQSRGKK
jgi:preprotein translocase subunit SecF